MPIPPLLLIDAGNTRVKWATAEGRGAIRLRGAMATGEMTAAEAGKLAGEFAGHRVAAACVVPKVAQVLRRAFARRIYLLSGDSRKLPLCLRYPKPAELGADRVAAAVAAQAEGRWPVIVVSCGTALAFTVLDGDGALCGGVIAPGLRPQLTALLGATAQLPATSLRLPKRLPARSTREAIRAGVVLNFQGGVKEIVARLSEALPSRPLPRLLLTGGDARFLTPVWGAKAEVRPLLVLEGLRMMGARVFRSDHDFAAS